MRGQIFPLNTQNHALAGHLFCAPTFLEEGLVDDHQQPLPEIRDDRAARRRLRLLMSDTRAPVLNSISLSTTSFGLREQMFGAE
jgi:hypothetical protein